MNLPKEALILHNNSIELYNIINICMKIISDCFTSKKSIYLSQLKKIRETTNIAIRNAVQYERSESIQYINNLKENLLNKNLNDNNKYNEIILNLENKIKNLENIIENLNNENKKLIELDKERIQLQNQAVLTAIEQNNNNLIKENEKLQCNYSEEKNILINNNKLQIDEIKKQCEVSR